jgi:two-component system nitrogen regulation response regulator NtrX
LNLDELGAENQHLLLLAIEANRFKRVGGTQELPIDVRFIMTSELSSGALIGTGFNVDLYHRLAVIEMETLALAEHLEDVPAMIEYFTDQFVKDEGLDYRHFDVSAQNRVRNQNLSGGVRELKNLVKRALTLGEIGDVTAQEINGLITTPIEPNHGGVLFKIPLHLNLRDARQEFEKSYLQHLLRTTSGSMAQLATKSGMERTHLYRKLRTLGVDAKKEAGKL